MAKCRNPHQGPLTPCPESTNFISSPQRSVQVVNGNYLGISGADEDSAVFLRLRDFFIGLYFFFFFFFLRQTGTLLGLDNLLFCLLYLRPKPQPRSQLCLSFLSFLPSSFSPCCSEPWYVRLHFRVSVSMEVYDHLNCTIFSLSFSQNPSLLAETLGHHCSSAHNAGRSRPQLCPEWIH